MLHYHWIDGSKPIVADQRPVRQLELDGHVSHTTGFEQAENDCVDIAARKTLFHGDGIKLHPEENGIRCSE